MTRGRYEIEFQGSADGQTLADLSLFVLSARPSKAPGIYAPYQPRFDWNLWFASLVPGALILSSCVPKNIPLRRRDVLLLFAGNPFPSAPRIRCAPSSAILVHHNAREALAAMVAPPTPGLYAPALEREPDAESPYSSGPQRPLPAIK